MWSGSLPAGPNPRRLEVAGVLGAYLVAFPRARVTSLLFLGIFVRLVEVPAALVLAVWFGLQFFQGTWAKVPEHRNQSSGKRVRGDRAHGAV